MPVKLKAKEKLVWLNEEKINIFFGPPSELLPLIILCESTNRKFPDSVKHLMLGSAPVHQGFLKRLVNVIHPHTKITCTYGMTEHLLVAIADGRDKINYNGDGDLLGKIVSGVDVKINDDNEIIVKSNQLYSRYFHLSNRSDWHETGDLGKIDSNGNLVLLGRKKEMLIRKDFNIYPALYEGTIKKIPDINEAALIGLYDENIHDEKVYLALETEIENLDIIRKLLEKGEYSIDKQALPDFIFKMKIPRKGRQDKIDRNAILQHIIEKKL
jgi:acyl-CoA synthetase (AMP-forming)/AMP-acid ligase II